MLSIDGLDELHEWRSGIRTVKLLPSRYDFGVEYRIGGASLIGFIVELVADRHPTVLSLEVKAGYRYLLHFQTSDDVYSVSETAISAPEPGWKAPPGARPCAPDPVAASRLLCPTRGSMRKGDGGSPAGDRAGPAAD